MSIPPATAFRVDSPSLTKDHLYVSWPAQNSLVNEQILAFGINTKPFQVLAKAGLGPTHLIFSDAASKDSITYAMPGGSGVVLNTNPVRHLLGAVAATIRKPDGVLAHQPYLEIDVNTDIIHQQAEQQIPLYRKNKHAYPYESAALDITNALVTKGMIAAVRHQKRLDRQTPGYRIFRVVRAMSLAGTVAVAMEGAPLRDVLATGFIVGLATVSAWSYTRKTPDGTTYEAPAANIKRNTISLLREKPPFALSFKRAS